VSYGSLVGGRKFSIALDPNARRRHPRDWTVLDAGAAPDLAAMATGGSSSCATCAPGMLHGQVIWPRPSARPSSSTRSVRDVPGLVKVVVKKDFVGGRREALERCRRGRLKLPGRRASAPAGGRPRYLRRQRPTRDTLLVDSKDVDEKLARAATVVTSTYLHPYQMHGSLGSSCAVADVQGDKATIWSPTQAIHPHRMTAAMVLGLRPENVRVVFRMGSGCYGLNGADTVSYDAALLSQAVGRPVRVQLNRKDEMAWENFGLAYVVDQRVGLDGEGNIVAWDCETWSPVGAGRAKEPRQRRHRLPGRLRARRVAPPARPRVVQQRQQRGALLRGGPRGRAKRRHG
jgi:nicotinate dehydrogenase subunit B